YPLAPKRSDCNTPTRVSHITRRWRRSGNDDLAVRNVTCNTLTAFIRFWATLYHPFGPTLRAREARAKGAPSDRHTVPSPDGHSEGQPRCPSPCPRPAPASRRTFRSIGPCRVSPGTP